MSPGDSWADGNAYDSYIGRWSRLIAREFIAWLAMPPVLDWIDVGCGTGALTQAILDEASPFSIKGIDPSPAYLSVSRQRIANSRVQFAEGTAQAIPGSDSAFNAAVSGLVLNFVAEPLDAVREMSRVVRARGTVALYVWDYADSMQLLRTFWDAATAVEPGAVELDEGKRRFPICNAGAITELFAAAGLQNIETRIIQVPTPFRNFDDYWLPFLAGQGPAGGFVASLSPERRDELREGLRTTLPTEADGAINLIAGAWAVRGTIPQ